MVKTLRASSLPLLEACAASAGTDGIVADSSSPESRLGDALHAAQAAIVLGRPGDLDVTAAWHRVDPGELGVLVSMARPLWEELRPHFPDPRCEVALEWEHEGVRLTGHADVLSVADGQVRVADWKSGHDGGSDHGWQLRAYGWLALDQHPECDSAYAAIVRVRDGVIEGESWSREQLTFWWMDEVLPRLGEGDRYSPGKACRYCPRALTCRGLVAQRWALAAAVSGGDMAEYLGGMDGAALGKLHTQLADLDRAIAAGKELVRTEVALRGGAVPIGDGRELALVSGSKRGINLAAARGVLEQFATPAAIDKAARIGNEAAEGLAKTWARGLGVKIGESLKVLWSQLEATGAVNREPTERLEVRRVNLPLIVEAKP